MALLRSFQHALFLSIWTILAWIGFSSSALAAERAGSPTATPRIVDAIDEANLVQLSGHTHPLAVPKYDVGAVEDSFPMEHMLLQLRRSPEQESALERSIAERQDPHSASYHQWLTAEELGRDFGPAQQDIETVSQWLSYHGFKVNVLSRNGLSMDVSGTAGQVREAFHTEIHKYNVNGKQQIANASDPSIPAALAPVVVGVVSLHNFMPKTASIKPIKSFSFPCNGCPDGYSGITQYDEAPADLATIYNVSPLYKSSQPITGKGQTVVVLEDTDMNPGDVATFRKAFGLASYSGTFTQIHPGTGCADPGIGSAEMEAAIDAEWAGAVAPDAAVELASCADTTTNFGAFIAAQNLLDSASPPPIMSLSYIGCEAAQGPSGNAYINSLWQQAVGEGIVGLPNDGKRDLPDVSLFASNGFWFHAILYCMSDTAQGGAPCDYTNDTITLLYNSAGGTSFTAPQFASIQALINQKAGGPQGNPAPIHYNLAKAEFGSSSHADWTTLKACNATRGKNIASSCIFYDVTAGNNAVPCYGTNNCYDPSPSGYGILSTSNLSLLEAYPARFGWDFASGPGSINVTNLVNAWP